MKTEPVEIYSQTPNAAIIRVPGRRFPGLVVQGDTLHSILASLKLVMQSAANLEDEPAGTLAGVVEHLEELLAHYRSVLNAHEIQLPFRD